MKNILLILFVVLISLSLISCEHKKKEPVVVIYNSYNSVEVKTGNLYYFPLSLNSGNGEIPFTIKKYPEGSTVITLGRNKYLCWEPKKSGTYEITINNESDSFQQSYEIVVKN